MENKSLNTDDDTFKHLVANDAQAKARWDAFTDQAIERAASKGIQISKADLAQIPGVRLYTLTGDASLASDWEADAAIRLPAFKKAQEVAELRDAITREDADAAVQDEWNKLSPQRKMQIARSAPDRPTETEEKTAADMSKADKAKLLARCERMRGGQRIAEYRRLKALGVL